MLYSNILTMRLLACEQSARLKAFIHQAQSDAGDFWPSQHLGNCFVWSHSQIENITSPHILAAMEPSAHRVELDSYAVFGLFPGQKALIYLQAQCIVDRGGCSLVSMRMLLCLYPHDLKHWKPSAFAHACKVYWAHQLVELFPADVPLLISALQGASFHHSHSASIPSTSRS